MLSSLIRCFRPRPKNAARKTAASILTVGNFAPSFQPLEDRQFMDGGLGASLTQPTTTYTTPALTAQASTATISLYSPPQGGAVEGKLWTLHSSFNSTFMGQRLSKDAFRAEIYWYHNKPANAQTSGKIMEAGEIKQVQDGVMEVTGKHMYTDDGHYQIRVLIFIKNHPKYSTTPWKYVTPPLTVWEAPVRAVAMPLKGQQGVLLRGTVATLISEDPTPKPGEFGGSVSVAPGAWATFKSKVTQQGNQVRFEVEGTPAGSGELSLNVNFHKLEKDKIVKALGNARVPAEVRKHDVMVTKAEWSATKPNVVKVTLQSQGYSGNATLRNYLSKDGTLDSSDTSLQGGIVVKLAAGETKTVELTLPLSANKSPFAQTYNCFAVVDPDKRIAEDNETNNWKPFQIKQAGVPLTWPGRHQSLQGRQLLDPKQINDPRMSDAIAVVAGTQQPQFPGSQKCYDFALPGGEAQLKKYAALALQGGLDEPQGLGSIGIIFNAQKVPVHAFVTIAQTSAKTSMSKATWLFGQRNGFSMVYITDKVGLKQGEFVRFVDP